MANLLQAAGIVELQAAADAGNTDVLSGTDLNEMPVGGQLTIEFASSMIYMGTDGVIGTPIYARANLRAPEGDNPLNNVLVPPNAMANYGGGAPGTDKLSAPPIAMLGPGATTLVLVARQGTRARLGFNKSAASLAPGLYVIWRATLVFAGAPVA